MTPVRIQLRRTRGWRMPAQTLKVDRSTKWGNPYVVVRAQLRDTGDRDDDGAPIMEGPWFVFFGNERSAVDGWGFASKREALQKASDLYRLKLTTSHDPAWVDLREATLDELRHKNLACWCGLCPEHAAGRPFNVPCEQCMPCHCDPLIEVSNRRIKP